HRVLEAFCTHPNVGAVLLVSLGCEEFRRGSLRETVKASGRPVELLVIHDAGATLMFEETCELIGCEDHMAGRAVTPELGAEIVAAVEKADRYYRELGHGSFGGGNIKFGVATTRERHSAATP